jgi:signal transduction histidine kinase
MTDQRGDLPQVKTSLQRQMTLTLSAAFVGLVLLVGLPMVFISVQIQQELLSQEQQRIADEMARTLSTILQGLRDNQLQTIITDPAHVGAEFIANEIATIINLTISRVSAQVQEAGQEQQPLDALFVSNPAIQGVQEYDSNGNLERSAWRNPAASLDAYQPNEASLRLTQQGFTTQEDFFFDENRLPVLVIATPTTSPQGQITGLILTWVNMPNIWPFMTNIPVGESGYLYIIDQAGNIVSQPDRLSGQPVPAAELPIEQLSSPYQGLSGEQVIGKASPIENTDWQVVIEISASEANRGLTSLLIILGAILLFGISLAIWMARLFSRWLLQPIHALQESAERITAGDFSHRIELNRSDELGFLAAAVNQMVAALEQTIKELRTVSLNLLSAQESERRRVAQEIHDELGQTLTALRLNLWMALQSDPENQTLSATHRQATEVQETARTLSHELRPAMLDDLGLLPTLEWYIDRVEQRANLAIVLETDFDESMISSGMKTALYRLIVEALTNITKHASASVAEICLNAREQGLHLIIQDDGAGFDTAILNQTQSLGLAGMRERVNLLQGQFLIESNLEQGTRITIDLPLNE